MAEVPYTPMDVKLEPYPHVEKPDYGRAEDPVGYLNSVEQRARERAVAYETAKILARRIKKCHQKEGVNHYENCRKEVLDYLEIINQPSLGQLQPDWKDPAKKQGFTGFTTMDDKPAPSSS